MHLMLNALNMHPTAIQNVDCSNKSKVVIISSNKGEEMGCKEQKIFSLLKQRQYDRIGEKAETMRVS